MARLCQLLGLSKQAYYQHNARKVKCNAKEFVVLAFIATIRRSQPKLGLCKLWRMYEKDLPPEYHVGREAFLRIGRENGFKIIKKAFTVRTTDSNHRFHKYENLIKDLEIMRPEQVWASDITYIPIAEGYAYLSLITDLYSKKIMGWALINNLSRSGPLEALSMAISNRLYPKAELIHHSDRGVQYCSDDYVKALTPHAKGGISMTQNGDPYENAVAERVNGILKQEFAIAGGFTDLVQAKAAIKEAVLIYNQERIHTSNSYLTPDEMHKQQVLKIKTYKSKTSIFKPGQEEETGNAEEQPASSIVPTMTERRDVQQHQHP